MCDEETKEKLQELSALIKDRRDWLSFPNNPRSLPSTLYEAMFPKEADQLIELIDSLTYI